MGKVKVITSEQAAVMVADGSTVASGGFVGCAHPEKLTSALERRFLSEGKPRGLTVVYPAGQGDGNTRGMNHLAHEGLVKRVIGGHWNLAPRLGKLALENRIEAYCFPQGVISHLFRDIAAGNPGTITHIGLETFVDPRNAGGKLSERAVEDLVELIELGGKKWLWYKSFPIHVGLLRGTFSDSFGNISFDNEVTTAEALSIAQAVKNSGGKVIVQVEGLVEDFSRDPKSISIPAIFVDAVILSEQTNHMQTFAEQFNPGYVSQGNIQEIDLPPMEVGPRRYISSRAFQEIGEGNIVNLGIGMPEGVARIAKERDMLEHMTLTVEAGPIGGVPAGGLSFGASHFPQAIIDQPYMRLAGIGGFMNITQTAKRVVFMGTFTAGGLETVFAEGKLKVVSEGKVPKFIAEVEQVTFSGPYALKKEQEVLYITERAVFRLTQAGPELVEVAPGIDVDRDIRKRMHFPLRVAKDLSVMGAEVFEC
jgi:propionate CoA-transferase